MFNNSKKKLLIAAAACLAILSPLTVQTAYAQQSEDDNISWHRASDQRMIDAKAKARETLPNFWTIKNSGDKNYSEFTIKAGLATPDNSVEHIWVNEVWQTPEGTIKGVLGNDPVNLPDLAYKSPVEFRPDEVSDWSYTKGGKMFGNYTTRVLLLDMPADEAAPYLAMLGENP